MMFEWKTWKYWFHAVFLMIYATAEGSRKPDKPSTAVPAGDHGGNEERNTTGTLRCRFREPEGDTNLKAIRSYIF